MKTTTIETWMFRTPTERLALAFSILLLGTIAYALSLFNIWLFIGLVALNLIYIRLQQQKLLGDGLRVSRNQLPMLYEILLSYATYLDTPRVNLYIVQDPNPNAYTFGFRTSTIVLASSLVENLTLEEIKFVVAHELGHVKAGHNIINSFISPLGNGIAYSNFIFSFWQRQAEYSADRCALALTRKTIPAISCLLKISFGMKIGAEINIEAYKYQLETTNDFLTGFAELLQTHPLSVNRVRSLLEFKQSSFS